jgi:hypothetical protein
MEAISAVSSPQTKAPAPSLIWMSKLKPLPRMFLAQQAALARPARWRRRRLMASGYSART